MAKLALQSIDERAPSAVDIWPQQINDSQLSSRPKRKKQWPACGSSGADNPGDQLRQGLAAIDYIGFLEDDANLLEEQAQAQGLGVPAGRPQNRPQSMPPRPASTPAASEVSSSVISASRILLGDQWGRQVMRYERALLAHMFRLRAAVGAAAIDSVNVADQQPPSPAGIGSDGHQAVANAAQSKIIAASQQPAAQADAAGWREKFMRGRCLYFGK